MAQAVFRRRYGFLLRNQRAIKDGPRIKIYLVGPPKAPAVFVFLPDRQLKQEMNSAFLVFDL
jgi:hypothetical protein